MINTYCQYSYGGFKTFRLLGEAEEAVSLEVTADERRGMPPAAQRFLQFGGCKMAYLTLDDGRLLLLVREIPSLHTDGDGRRIPCVALFVGEPADRHALNNLMTSIVRDRAEFEEFFARLFYVRQGLRVHGERLSERLKSHETAEMNIDALPAELRNACRKDDGVLLFVPLSAKFGSDSTVTQNVCRDLALDNVSDVLSATITQQALNSLTFGSPEPAATPVEPPAHPSAKPSEQASAKPSEQAPAKPSEQAPAKLVEQAPAKSATGSAAANGRVAQLEREKSELAGKLSQAQNSDRRHRSELAMYKKIAYGLAGLSGLLLIALLCLGNCSRADGGSDNAGSTENAQEIHQTN